MHHIYNPLAIDPELVNARVTAAKWYRSRYIAEEADLPVVIEGSRRGILLAGETKIRKISPDTAS